MSRYILSLSCINVCERTMRKNRKEKNLCSLAFQILSVTEKKKIAVFLLQFEVLDWDACLKCSKCFNRMLTESSLFII